VPPIKSVSSSVDAGVITAVYQFIPTNYAWSKNNVGTYNVYIRSNQVKDVYGNAMPSTKVGRFVVRTAQTQSGFSVTTTPYVSQPELAPVPKSATKSLLFSDKPIL